MTKINLEKIDNSKIRRQFDEPEGRWYFSIVDIIEIIANTTDAQNYWKTLKNRLKKGQNELVTRCNQLKMRASDGKMYLTDVADTDTMIEIIKIISEPAIAPFRLWFDKIESIQNHRESVFGEEKVVKLLIDAYETDTEIVVQAFTCGVPPGDISVSAEYKTLTIRYKNFEIKGMSEENKIMKEINHGEFSRVIPLPSIVEIDTVEANIHYGLLTVKMKKLDITRKKEIKVKPI
jgi:HSP20 family molecular chaperone IbpA